MSQDTSFTPPNSDGWVSPDDFFTSTQHVDIKSNGHLRSSTRQETEKQTNDKKPERPQQECTMKGAPEADGAKHYLQRFVRLLLDASNINDDEVETVNHAELKFSLSGDDLMTLQQFARDSDAKAISLRRVDQILEAMLLKPYSYFPKLPKFPNFEGFLHFLKNFKVGSSFISIFLPAVWFIVVVAMTRNVVKSFVWLTPVAFLSSFITTAQRLYDEEEVKQYELMQKYSDIPEHCFHPGKEWSLSDLLPRISKDDCSRYFKLHNIDSKLGITTVKVFSKMFGESISDLMEHLGVGTSNYFAAFAEMSIINRILVLPVAAVLLCIFCAIVLSWLSGGSIRLPFFLGSLNFHKPHQQKNAVSSDHPTNVLTASTQPEAALSTSNITINFHQALPPNVHEVIRTFSQNQFPNLNAALPASSSESVAQQQLHGSMTVPDRLAGGDTFPSDLQMGSSHSSGSTSRRLSRPSANVSLKKFPKQFTQLEAKYKSGNKSVSISSFRARHRSL